MAARDLATTDASVDASRKLETVLNRTKKKALAPRVPVSEALRQPAIVKADSTRNVTRVLFVSQDSSLLNPDTQSLDGFLSLSDLFDEVHILILREGVAAKDPVLRVSHNVWLYTATSKWWFLTPRAGIELVRKELVFAAGFRPDLIVARDPFESAIVAKRISRMFNRPLQLHVLDDYTTNDFIKKARHNWWRRFMPRFTVGSFLSVRAAAGSIERLLARRFTIPDLSILPKFHDYESIMNAKATIDLKDKYRSFVFTIVFIGKLTHESTLYHAIDAVRFALQNPRIGFVVIGDGPAKGEFKRRAKLLGIERQVVFETRESDYIPYLKSANILLVTDTDSDSDELILTGAAAGIPIIMSRTPRREDIFEHGVSAYLCEEADTQAFASRINDLLNNVGMRKIFTQNAQAVITKRFHQNLKDYRESYRTTVEHALFVESDSDVYGSSTGNVRG
jgi:glycosyltransferase involved in cell wall biosynthesis